MYSRIGLKHNHGEPVSQKQSFESIKYFTYWITIKRVFPNIVVESINGTYRVNDPTDESYKWLLGSGTSIDNAIEEAFHNKEVTKRLAKS